MEVVVVLLAFTLLAVVVAVVAAPLRASLERPTGQPPERVSPERAELEAQREAKYREIRDAELDYRTGKLSREDYASLDAVLRSEGLEILNRLEALDDTAEPNPEVEG